MDQNSKSTPNPHEAQLTGRWLIRCYGPGGELRDERQGQNVICTNGKEWLASYLQSAVGAAATNTMRYIAVGDDATGELAANTQLGNELVRHTGTVSYVSGGIYKITATFTTGTAIGSVSEYGLISSNTNGTMLSRDTEDTMNIGADDTLVAVCQITIS
jgi:hypothetical protein